MCLGHRQTNTWHPPPWTSSLCSLVPSVRQAHLPRYSLGDMRRGGCSGSNSRYPQLCRGLRSASWSARCRQFQVHLPSSSFNKCLLNAHCCGKEMRDRLGWDGVESPNTQAQPSAYSTVFQKWEDWDRKACPNLRDHEGIRVEATLELRVKRCRY